MTAGLVLTALEGSNPLAFLAALGVLRAADDAARRAGSVRPRLAWREEPTWRPVLQGVTDAETLVALLDDDRASWAEEPALTFAYTKDGARAPAGARGAVRDLKPPPALMRALLVDVAERAAAGDDRSARQAAAYGTDVARDLNGNTKPTALHFTAGQQTFLGAVAELQAAVDRELLRQAVFGPWAATNVVRSLGWDPLGATAARPYALRPSNPSGEKRPCVPGAEWLAFRGLGCFAVVSRGGAVRTPGVEGGWKTSTFAWPLWTGAISLRVVESLLRLPRLRELGATERATMGLGAVYQAPIERSDQGGYGSFRPSRAL